MPEVDQVELEREGMQIGELSSCLKCLICQYELYDLIKYHQVDAFNVDLLMSLTVVGEK